MLWALITAIALAGAPHPSRSPQRPCVPAAQGERFSVDFDAVPLGTVARLVSCAAELSFMYEPATLSRQTITVVAPRPVGLSELIALFRSAVADAGLVIERRDAYWLIRGPSP